MKARRALLVLSSKALSFPATPATPASQIFRQPLHQRLRFHLKPTITDILSNMTTLKKDTPDYLTIQAIHFIQTNVFNI
jgi:hypothetical protein